MAERRGTQRGDPDAAERSDAKMAATERKRLIKLECVREPKLGRPSRRTVEVGLNFGIPLYGARSTIVEPTRVPLEPGKIVLIVGPSGSGKSSALGQIERACAGGCMVHRRFPPPLSGAWYSCCSETQGSASLHPGL